MTETVFWFHMRISSGQNSVRAVIAVCMATFNPDRELFRAQVESIRRQTLSDWHCFVSDDGSTPECLSAIEEEIAGDPLFTLSASTVNRGFYRNFEYDHSMWAIMGLLIAGADALKPRLAREEAHAVLTPRPGPSSAQGSSRA